MYHLFLSLTDPEIVSRVNSLDIIVVIAGLYIGVCRPVPKDIVHCRINRLLWYTQPVHGSMLFTVYINCKKRQSVEARSGTEMATGLLPFASCPDSNLPHMLLQLLQEILMGYIVIISNHQGNKPQLITSPLPFPD